MAQVQRLLKVLLDAPVQRDDAAVGRIVGAVGGELQAGAAKAVLLLEDGVVVDGHLDGLVLGGGVELGRQRAARGLLEDLRPGDVVALDVVRVEDAVGRVERGEGRVGGHAAVQQDRALGGSGVDLAVTRAVARPVSGRAVGRREGGGGQRGEDDKERRHFGLLCKGMAGVKSEQSFKLILYKEWKASCLAVCRTKGQRLHRAKWVGEPCLYGT